MLIDWIQEAPEAFDAMAINPAGYAHTSVALLGAVLAAALPTMEARLSDIDAREGFRKISYARQACVASISDKNFGGYAGADHLISAKEITQTEYLCAPTRFTMHNYAWYTVLQYGKAGDLRYGQGVHRWA